jgi:hypothetical protein
MWTIKEQASQDRGGLQDEWYSNPVVVATAVSIGPILLSSLLLITTGGSKRSLPFFWPFHKEGAAKQITLGLIGLAVTALPVYHTVLWSMMHNTSVNDTAL